MVRCLSYILASFALLACNRGGVESSSSTIVIRAPAHLRGQVPAGQTACYGVNVTGGDLKATSGNACMPTSAINAGFVQSGQDIQASVPRGKIIQVDLYLYLEPTGTNVPCPTWADAMSASQISNVFLLGSATNVSTADDQTNVTITANYTGTNIVQQNSLPAVCAAGATGGISNFSLDTGGGTSSTANLKMKAQLSSGHSMALQGTNVKLIVR